MNSLSSKDISRAVFTALATALICAYLLWSVIFGGNPLGLNVPVGIVIFYASLFVSLHGHTDLRAANNILMLPLIFVLALSFAIFNNVLLQVLAFLSIIILTAAQVSLMTGLFAHEPYSASFSGEICTAIFLRPFHRIGDYYKSLFSSFGSNSRRIGFVFLGIAIALPVAIILLLLLASADSVFGKMLSGIFNSGSVVDMLTYLLLFALLATFGGSFAMSLLRGAGKPAFKEKPEKKQLPATPLIAALTVICAILLIFSVVQVVFLFGGGTLPKGLTYSSYARSGFFQLCAAAAIVFAVTAISLSLKKRLTGGRTFMNVLLTLLCASIFIMLVSSFYRMALYEGAFGFTRLRLYVQAFMILLAVVNAYVAARVWVKLPVMKLTFYTVFIALIGLIFFNVDGFIAKNTTADLSTAVVSRNEYLERYDSDSFFGTNVFNSDSYLLGLSEDALPYYIDSLKTSILDKKSYGADDDYDDSYKTDCETARIQVAYRIVSLLDRSRDGDWRSYNWYRAVAGRIADDHKELLEKAQSVLDNK